MIQRNKSWKNVNENLRDEEKARVDIKMAVRKQNLKTNIVIM